MTITGTPIHSMSAHSASSDAVKNRRIKTGDITKKMPAATARMNMLSYGGMSENTMSLSIVHHEILDMNALKTLDGLPSSVPHWVTTLWR
jgi:hypothetical protein